MKNTAIAIIVVALLAAAWFFVSPLFIDKAVDESFDYMGADGTVDIDKVMAMPEDKRQEMKQEIMDAAAKAPDVEQVDDRLNVAPKVVAIGQFVDADAVHKGSGTATLYELPDGNSLVRFENFRTTNGPDLVVYLAKHRDPKTAADVTDRGFVSLGKLKGNVGNQNYPIPAGTSLEDYGSVVIWCELFGVLFSPAPLKRIAVVPMGG